MSDQITSDEHFEQSHQFIRARKERAAKMIMRAGYLFAVIPVVAFFVSFFVPQMRSDFGAIFGSAISAIAMAWLMAKFSGYLYDRLDNGGELVEGQVIGKPYDGSEYFFKAVPFGDLLHDLLARHFSLRSVDYRYKYNGKSYRGHTFMFLDENVVKDAKGNARVLVDKGLPAIRSFVILHTDEEEAGDTSTFQN